MNETIFGTHNSMSYLPPLHWWGWLMIPFARCQNKTIDEQLAAGARCFDLRVAFDRHDMAHFRHGWCRFGGGDTVTSVLTRRTAHAVERRQESPRAESGAKARPRERVLLSAPLRPLPKDLPGADVHRRQPKIRLGAAPRLRHWRHTPAPEGLLDGLKGHMVATPAAVALCKKA